MHSAKIHTFALSFQKTTKCNQYETERCYNGMACRIHYQLYDADGCTEKSRKLEKKNVKVETISVGNTNLGERKTMWEPVEEKMGSTLSFEIAGNITSIRVEEGDRVSKGQLLATINPTTVKEAHRATLTTLKQAQDAYRRFLPLHQSEPSRI